MREFEIAIGRSALPHNDDVVYKLGDKELTAKAPTTGQLALFLQGAREGGLRSVTRMLEFLSDVSSDADWRYIEDKLRDGLDMAIINQITSFLIGEWSGRPTQPSSDSSPTPNGTGPSSTVKRRAVEATTSDSPSTDSAMSSSGG